MGRVLLAGAGGGVGSRLRRLLKRHCSELLLSDLKVSQSLEADEVLITADLANMPEVMRAAAGRRSRRLQPFRVLTDV